MARNSSKMLSEQQFRSISSKLRGYLRGLSSRRRNGQVTADDAHNYLDRQGVSSTDVSTRLRFINTVFPNYFEAVGRTQSSRPVARGRRINVWVSR